jgi:hypothetical protein
MPVVAANHSVVVAGDFTWMSTGGRVLTGYKIKASNRLQWGTKDITAARGYNAALLVLSTAAKVLPSLVRVANNYPGCVRSRVVGASEKASLTNLVQGRRYRILQFSTMRD